MSRDEKTSFKKEDILFIFKKMYEMRSLRETWDEYQVGRDEMGILENKLGI